MKGPRSWGGLARRGAGRATSASDAWRAAGRDAEPSARGSDWQPEQWIDEGELRDEAADAVGRSRQAAQPAPARSERAPRAVDDVGDDELKGAVAPNRLARFEARLKDATDAFRRERYEDARRTLRPLAQQAPGASSVRELYGLTLYRLGRWAQAARELEAFRTQTGSRSSTPCSPTATGRSGATARSRSCGRSSGPPVPGPSSWPRVASWPPGPSPTRGASTRRSSSWPPGPSPPAGPSSTTCRVAYALADLYERAGELPRARELFGLVANADPDFVDVQARLRALR